MFQRILIGVDFTACSDQALDVARLHFPRAQRRLVYVAPMLPTVTSSLNRLDIFPGKDELEHDLAQLEQRRFADETVQRMSGHAAEELLAEALAWGADLIVVGTHGRRGVERVLFTSVAERVVRDATVPVLTVGLRTAPASVQEPADHPAVVLPTPS